MNLLRRLLPGIALVLGAFLLSIGIQTLAAWTPPGGSPPSSNAYAPLNTGPDTQTKSGALNVTGNVGIGTAAPGAKLEVAGQVKITGGSPGAGKVLTSDASGLATWTASASSGVTGSGSINYLSKWTGASTLGNSLIYDNGTNIGIGTAAPLGKLHIAGGAVLIGTTPLGPAIPDGKLVVTNNIYRANNGTGYVTFIGDLKEATADFPGQVLFGSGYCSTSCNGDAPLGLVGGIINPFGIFTFTNTRGNPQNQMNEVWARGFQVRYYDAQANNALRFEQESAGGPFITRHVSDSYVYQQFNQDNTINLANNQWLIKTDGSYGINTTAESYPVNDPINNTYQYLQAVGNSRIRTGCYDVQSGACAFVINPAGGTVGIGTETPSAAYKLYVNGTAYSTGGWQSSDARYKENINPIASPLDRLLTVRGVSYTWKTGEEYKTKGFPSGTHYGVIAQEIEKVFPEVVQTSPNGDKAVSYTELVPVLIESVKELKAENESLKARTGVLEKRIEILEAR